MCGFAGFVDFKGEGDLSLVKSMADSLLHRGPDDGGYELRSFKDSLIGFGFRRLAIIDLSPLGHQPMFSGDEQVMLMMNGEVYNFSEIRQTLISKGHSFRSGSDTEVVLKSYLEYGIECVNQFIGMFSIVILDKSKGKFYLIRDRAGIKPLFYHEYSNGFLFASELKAFHRHPAFEKKIDLSSLKTFFLNGNIPAPGTIFMSTSKVEPGEIVELDLNNNSIKKSKYWDVFSAYNAPQNKISYEDALVETENKMRSAFNYRMVADVPVGVFLSGGYDSTAVASLLSTSVSDLNTFTIAFREKNYDESPFAKKVAEHLGTKHHEYYCTMEEAMEIIPNLPWIYDEPFGDSSAIPTTLVSKIARQHVTVALSADAGDELFAGYPRHQKVLNYVQKLSKVPSFFRMLAGAGLNGVNGLHTSISKADRIEKLKLILGAKGVLEAFNYINQTYTQREINKIVNSNALLNASVFDKDAELNSQVSVLNKVLAVEYKSYLVDDILQKVDRATMSVSLEGREPFLDHRLVEWVSTLPDEYKLKDGVSKRILKDIVHKYVPASMMERPKMGFGVPVSKWLKSELRELLDDVMSDSSLKNQHLLHPEVIAELREQYLAGKLEDFERLWFVFVFLQWYKKWM
jgi:asparagine synthase (glutamine-hydrolysing)